MACLPTGHLGLWAIPFIKMSIREEEERCSVGGQTTVEEHRMSLREGLRLCWSPKWQCGKGATAESPAHCRLYDFLDLQIHGAAVGTPS